MSVNLSRSERFTNTRKALLLAARTLFAQRGFAATLTEDVVSSAGLTRGALYHHFADKHDLFRGVYVEMQAEIELRTTQASAEKLSELRRHGDPKGLFLREQIIAGCNAYLDACADPAYRRIVLIDAPSVLDLRTRLEISADSQVEALARVLRGAMNLGELTRQPARPLAHLLMGALGAAGFYIGNADDVSSARDQVAATLRSLIDGLRPAVPAGET
jgi:AcrR family transcriptional regulator